MTVSTPDFDDTSIDAPVQAGQAQAERGGEADHQVLVKAGAEPARIQEEETGNKSPTQVMEPVSPLTARLAVADTPGDAVTAAAAKAPAAEVAGVAEVDAEDAGDTRGETPAKKKENKSLAGAQLFFFYGLPDLLLDIALLTL